jgi:hypothetical protein
MGAKYDFYTYILKRKCLHCGTPIADQVHALTKFCPREVMGDGSIKSCKDDYHVPLKKIRNRQYKNIAAYHKEAHKRIDKLLLEKGETVNTEQLNQYGIKLHRPIQFSVDSAQKGTYSFVEFAITQIGNTQFKIFRHGLEF